MEMHTVLSYKHIEFQLIYCSKALYEEKVKAYVISLSPPFLYPLKTIKIYLALYSGIA